MTVAADTVDVWDVAHPAAGRDGPDVGPTPLTPAERRRADEMPSETARRAFVVTRTALRLLLGSRLGCGPDEVPVTTDPQGKPVLGRTGRAEARRVHFNVSHTAHRSLIAVGRRPIGVDVEHVDRPAHRDVERVADLILTDAEHDELSQLDPGGRRRRLLSLWVRKEAVAKGVGLGVRLPFRLVDVRGHRVRLPAGPTWCTDLTIDPRDPQYVAAVAQPEPAVAIRRRTWRCHHVEDASAVATVAAGGDRP